jgi:hypothetical protein
MRFFPIVSLCLKYDEAWQETQNPELRNQPIESDRLLEIKRGWKAEIQARIPQLMALMIETKTTDEIRLIMIELVYFNSWLASNGGWR